MMKLSLSFVTTIAIWMSSAICNPLALAIEPRDDSNILSPEELIERALNALGGEDNLKTVKGISFRAPQFYRTQTLMQNYNLVKSDQFVAIEGHQNISFLYDSEDLQLRIDRHFVPSDYWIWGKGSLDPIDFSLVVRGGRNGFACYVHGNNLIYMPPDYTAGYTDDECLLAEYLEHVGIMMSPQLLPLVKFNNASSSSKITLRHGVELSGGKFVNDWYDFRFAKMVLVTDSKLNLTIILHPLTSLPYIIRSYEDHPIFGPTTYDLQLSNYTIVKGLQLPQRFQTIYNTALGSDAVLEDFLVESIEVNPDYPSNFFQGLPSNESETEKAAPRKDPQYPHAEIGEGFSNMIWGFDTAPLGNISAVHPLPNVDQLWVLMYENSAYAQMIMEFEDGVIVADAPPHQSLTTIKWVQDNLQKPVTHLWPSHHHRDHTGGAAEFVKIGAKLIVPEIAADYWRSIRNASLQTYTEDHPYVHKDDKLQAWFMWTREAVHAVDWSYAMVTSHCPRERDAIAVFNADAWSPGTNATRWDQGFARQWIDQIADDGLSRDTVVVPAHGVPTPLEDLLNITGYFYPNLSTLDWRGGALRCDK